MPVDCINLKYKVATAMRRMQTTVNIISLFNPARHNRCYLLFILFIYKCDISGIPQQVEDFGDE